MNHPTEVVAEEFHHLKSQLEANEFVNNKLAELREENRGLKSANILLQRELESLKGDASSDSQKSDDLPEIIFEKKRSFSNGSSESDTCDDFVYNYNFHVAIWKARRQEAESIIKTILEDVLAEVVKERPVHQESGQIPLEPTPPPSGVHHSANIPRVGTGPGTRIRHRGRFCKAKVVRDESKPDNHTRRKRNRPL